MMAPSTAQGKLRTKQGACKSATSIYMKGRSTPRRKTLAASPSQRAQVLSSPTVSDIKTSTQTASVKKSRKRAAKIKSCARSFKKIRAAKLTLQNMPDSVLAEVTCSGFLPSTDVISRISAVNWRFNRICKGSLQHLDLHCLNLDTLNLHKLLSDFNHVEILDLSFCEGKVDANTILLLEKTLKYLSLRSIRIKDKDLATFSRLSKLEHLDISRHNKEQGRDITPKSLLKLFSPLKKLKYANLSGIESLDDDCVQALAKSSPALNHLSMQLCENVTDKSCQALAALPLLHLDMMGCHQITDEGLGLLTSEIPVLPCAAPCWNPLLKPEPGLHSKVQPGLAGCDASSSTGCSVVHLHTLVLAHCSRLGTRAVLDLVGRLPCLRYIDLRHCSGVSEVMRRQAERFALPAPPVGGEAPVSLQHASQPPLETRPRLPPRRLLAPNLNQRRGHVETTKKPAPPVGRRGLRLSQTQAPAAPARLPVVADNLAWAARMSTGRHAGRERRALEFTR